ncbi:Sjogren's syndrome/scleroderma autoantigen 1 family protein [Halovenus salina]|uniref:Sjogren's syndrome/scleroderma autoantigen 1 family protein n=1 Tax=Halovenus salina TaxID=1510225 RepID=A0ABD5W4G3_9EURY|nr:Sjogren's syndrome/scleroderma autoantigen 1 family protein [Halovenus salina]
MSEFDEEAERERLREKYERDQQKRETTEKMSELLLQGATMTNAHCSECNDPIFRYDGQEFCASCEKPVDRETSEDGQNSAIEVTEPSDEARVKFGGSSEQTDRSQPDNSQDEESVDRTHQQSSTSAQEASTSAQDTPRQPPSNGTTEQHTADQSARDAPAEHRTTRNQQSQQPQRTRQQAHAGESDVGAVRDSLVRTLQRFSERAEACEDPQRAREHLAAAREAAETLEALRR